MGETIQAVMISIRPQWCQAIASGLKTVEVRKTQPKLNPPFKCYIYCTAPHTNSPHEILEVHAADGKIRKCNGKVMGEFMCDNITHIFNAATDDWQLLKGSIHENHKRILSDLALLTEEQVHKYANGNWLYGWHISNFVLYDIPKGLSEFTTIDHTAVQKCKHRHICGQPEAVTNHNGWLKGSYTCDKGAYVDWCNKCHRKSLSRPPQAWCYIYEKSNTQYKNS